MTCRSTSRSFAGTLRNVVAVGTDRLRSMLATMAAPTPLIGLPASSLATVAATTAAAGAAAGAGDAGLSPSPVPGGGAGFDVAGTTELTGGTVSVTCGATVTPCVSARPTWVPSDDGAATDGAFPPR